MLQAEWTRISNIAASPSYLILFSRSPFGHPKNRPNIDLAFLYSSPKASNLSDFLFILPLNSGFTLVDLMSFASLLP